MQKLTICGLGQDPKGKHQSGKTKGGVQFECEINPEKISHTKGLKWNTENTANTSGKDTKQFQGYEVERLTFDFIIDGTGVASGKTVASQLKKLHAAVYDYDSGIHKPKYCAVIWGSYYGFEGHMEKLTVDYTLFASDGKPLRAKVNIVFIDLVNREEKNRKFNNNSPDMTHLKTIREGDRLPLMCNEIYYDPKYYLHIADMNDLTNFRNIPIGKRLLFPPLINS